MICISLNIHRVNQSSKPCFRLGTDLWLKVCDYGMSKELFQKHYYHVSKETEPVPIRWMAPECITLAKFSVKSDVVINFFLFVI